MTLARKHSNNNVPQQFVEMLLHCKKYSGNFYRAGTGSKFKGRHSKFCLAYLVIFTENIWDIYYFLETLHVFFSKVLL